MGLVDHPVGLRRVSASGGSKGLLPVLPRVVGHADLVQLRYRRWPSQRLPEQRGVQDLHRGQEGGLPHRLLGRGGRLRPREVRQLQDVALLEVGRVLDVLRP